MIADKKRKILETHICENSLLIMEGKSEQIRNGDVAYPFRQDSDFLLLTGLDVPDLKLIGMRRNEEMKWILYSDPISEKEKVWGTSRLSHEELRDISGIIEIREMSHFTRDRKIAAREAQYIYLRSDISKRGFTSWREKILSLEPFLRDLRMIKLPEEIEKIREAIRVTKLAHDHIRTIIEPGLYEYEIEAEIARIFRAHHMMEAYPSIVASGGNGCTLHYTRHDRRIEVGDLVLVDAGAEYIGYAADITRVFLPHPDPLLKEREDSTAGFSHRQKQVYDSVLAVKEYAESLIRPGVKKSDYEKKVRERMNEELVKLGLCNPLCKEGAEGNEAGDLVSGVPEQNPQSLRASSFIKELSETLSRKYYPHSTSHFLGLDVHDVGSREEIFRAGMVITCEPGIYIPEESIGIRLEDDILITEDGCENLRTYP